MDILDIPLYDKGMNSAVEHVCEISITQALRKNRCISATGAHGLIIAKEDINFAGILRSFYINLPDGRPGALIGRLKGAKTMEQCTGPDFFRNVIETSAQTKINHFFCGGKIGVADRLKEVCEQKYGNQNVVGTYSPPFRRLNEDEMKALGEEVDNKNVDILWIGLSTPKQEYFASEIRNYVHVHFIITVGAAFDFHSGRFKYTPPFMRKIGLEWLYRLYLEPKRLIRRDIEIIPKFIYYNILDLFTNKK
ncbi:MAG: WecB/TagA/CpsF family glycosyltransferase [Bacteroidales bacterium]|nr:WecB/TagA/CpsF family glycosyltransferase [Bacteroidales bacterium]